MLEEFSFTYKEYDIEQFWYMKIWPLKIQACLTDGKNMMADKNELFSARLELEKEQFSKQILQFQQNFEKIKEFTNLEKSQEFSTDAFQLKEALQLATIKVDEFHKREVLFNLPETPYPDLEDININFKPFYELTTIAYDVKNYFQDWTNNQLMR